MKNKIRKNNSGFLALMSSIIISAILLFITINTSFNGFYTRFNILDTEIKERSFALADSCLDIALLKFIQDSSFSGNINNSVSENSCYIGPVTTSGTQKTFKIKGVYLNAHTNLKVVVNGTNFKVISVEEIPTY